MTDEQLFEETCMKCSMSNDCFARMMRYPRSEVLCGNYGRFKEFFLRWKLNRKARKNK